MLSAFTSLSMNSILLAAANTGGGSGAGIFAGVGVVFLLLALLVAAFWIWMLIDCLTSDLPTNEKIIWALVIFFLSGLGALLYFFIGRKGSATRVTT